MARRCTEPAAVNNDSLLTTGNGMFHSLSEDSPTELRAELKDITCLAALIDTVAKSYI